MPYAIRLIAIVCAGFAALGAAQAERRVALVVGNANYGHHAGLPNVPNDAAAMVALFRAARFDSVEARANLSVAELRRVLREFSRQAAGADVAVLYFAGHGIEVDRTNYLIPVDARLASDLDVEDETVSLDRVLQLLEPARRLRLVILDACRDNPFAAGMKRSTATRSIGRGLGRSDPAGSNTLIAYATRANAVAEDGRGANSPYTAALVKHLTVPGLDVMLALRQVRDEVLAATGNRQEPYFTGSLGGGTLSLVGPAQPVVQPQPVTPPRVPSSLNQAKEAWDAVKDSSSVPALEAFIRRFPDTFYTDLAKVRLADLQKPPKPTPTPAPGSIAGGAPARDLEHLPAPTSRAAACAERGGIAYCVSSVLPRSGVNTGEYGPRSLIDGDRTTAWVEGSSGHGNGEWIVLSWAAERRLAGLLIVNGYGKSGRLFERNGRVARARLDFSNGRSLEVALRDTMGAQQVTISPPVPARWVRLQILDVARGSAHSDTAISELSPVFE